MNNRAFTLVEIIVVFLVVSLLSGVGYKLMTGTFSQFFKSQTKLTNLRSASLILERLKSDIRLAVIPQNTSEKPKIISVSKKCNFSFVILSNGNRKRVTYTYENSDVFRHLEGSGKRKISHAKVSEFKVEQPEKSNDTMLAIKICVDKDKDKARRSKKDKGNLVELQAILYPRFFHKAVNDEEKYWNLARNL